MYQEIQFHPCYTLDREQILANNKVFFIPSGDLYLLGVLNSPLMWWHNWRYLPHMKDEALTPAGFLMDRLPVKQPTDLIREAVEQEVKRLIDITAEQRAGGRSILDWLKLEHGVEKPSQKLQAVDTLDADGLAAEVKKARGKNNALTVAQLKALKEEHARSVVPLRALAAEAGRLEARVADLVNAAYGLTPEEVALMWRTAPPRMPGVAPSGGGGSMKLPNLESAFVSEEKVTNYLLNPKHPDGASKAAFFDALGFSAENWQELALALLRLAETAPVARCVDSVHGCKYIIEGCLESPCGKAPRVRSVWIVDRGGDVPRLVTAYPQD